MLGWLFQPFPMAKGWITVGQSTVKKHPPFPPNWASHLGDICVGGWTNSRLVNFPSSPGFLFWVTLMCSRATSRRFI